MDKDSSVKTIPVPIKTTLHYVTLMSGLIALAGKQLTNMEIEILSNFIDIHLELEKSGIQINPFSTEMKKKVAASLQRDDFNTLNNYIKSLADKKVIFRTDKGYRIHPALIPGSEEAILFRFKR